MTICRLILAGAAALASGAAFATPFDTEQKPGSATLQCIGLHPRRAGQELALDAR